MSGKLKEISLNLLMLLNTETKEFEGVKLAPIVSVEPEKVTGSEIKTNNNSEIANAITTEITDEITNKISNEITNQTQQNTIEKMEKENSVLMQICKLFVINNCSSDQINKFVETDEVEIIAKLFELGLDFQSMNKKSLSNNMLYLALKHEKYEIAQYLIGYGFNVNDVIGDEQMIFQLIREAGLKQLKFLLKYGLELNVCAQGWDKIVPLGLAAYNGNIDIVKLLVENGADVNKPNSLGQSPLDLALCNGHNDVAKFLIDNGADINNKNKQNNMFGTVLTPLETVIAKSNNTMTRFLLEKGAIYDESKFGESTKFTVAHIKKEIENEKQQNAKKDDVTKPESIPVPLANEPVLPTSSLVEDSIEVTVPIKGVNYIYKGKMSGLLNFIKTVQGVYSIRE